MMVVIERDQMARWARRLREEHGGSGEFEAGYAAAMGAVEAMLMLVNAYDLDKLAELPHPGLFTPDEVAAAMALHARGDSRFKAWEKILYSPSEVRGILEDRARKGL